MEIKKYSIITHNLLKTPIDHLIYYAIPTHSLAIRIHSHYSILSVIFLLMCAHQSLIAMKSELRLKAKKIEHMKQEIINKKLWQAANEGHIEHFNHALSLGADPHYTCMIRKNCTPLLLACKQNNREITTQLTSFKNIDIGALSLDNESPFLIAAHNNDTALLTILLKSDYKHTQELEKQKIEAFMYAAHNGLTHTMNILLQLPELHTTTLYGQALIKTAENGHDQIVALILHAMPIESTHDHEYITDYYNARTLAAQRGHASTVAHLLYNPDHKSRRGYTVLSKAVIAGHPSVVHTILTCAQDFTYGHAQEQEQGQSIVNLTKDFAIKQILYDAIKAQRSEIMLKRALAATQEREAVEIHLARHQDHVLQSIEYMKEHAYALAKRASQRRSDVENARSDADTEAYHAARTLLSSSIIRTNRHTTPPSEHSPSSSQDLSDTVYVSLQQSSDEDDTWVVDDFNKS